ncbi:hypothetical protein ZHAS_00019069 [Anopheles sinensis]|uniref:Uncharacterized protein n=1 Tax=Anopheles sinensis TaxID=74873 RepID=A0A084WLC6_ANOSI|nr:hypothetical protein ZHAS_00019069 [Anopheles sinensis]
MHALSRGEEEEKGPTPGVNDVSGVCSKRCSRPISDDVEVAKVEQAAGGGGGERERLEG